MTNISSDLLQDYLNGRLEDDCAEIVERALRQNPDASAELERLRENAHVLRSRETDVELPADWLIMLGAKKI